jgi:hypothetical protein
MNKPFDQSNRGPRRTVQLMGEAHWPGGRSAEVVLSNLSYDGCELSSRHSFQRGETIMLRLPDRGVIRAQIRWVRNGKAGARFLTGDSVVDARRARIGV